MEKKPTPAKKLNNGKRSEIPHRLEQLGADRLAFIHAVFTQDTMSMYDLAHHVMNVWGECKEIDFATVRKLLTRYRNSYLAAKSLVLQSPKIDPALTEKARGLLDRLEEDIDELQELQELIRIQKARVKKGYDFEQKNPIVLSGDVSREIKQLGDLLFKYGDVKMNRGLVLKVDNSSNTHIHIGLTATEQELFQSYSNNVVLKQASIRAMEILQTKGVINGSDHTSIIEGDQ